MKKKTPDNTKFYNDFASQYHLIFADWHRSVQRQGRILHNLLTFGQDSKLEILDCSCGIGTQALGLAQHGHKIMATDISEAEVRRAKQEARKVGLSNIQFGVADFRKLDRQVKGQFQAVISCDNSLPHLLTVADLKLALENMRLKLHPGGKLLLSLRDYDQLLKEKPKATIPNEFDGGKRLTFQTWDWQPDGLSYIVNQFILEQGKRGWKTTCHSGRYRALKRSELISLLREVGFTKIKVLFPDECPRDARTA